MPRIVRRSSVPLNGGVNETVDTVAVNGVVTHSKSETPPGLRAFVFHRLDLSIDSHNHGIGDCPLCMSEGHLSIDCATGLWRCWKCNSGGNPLGFIRLLYGADPRTGLPLESPRMAPSGPGPAGSPSLAAAGPDAAQLILGPLLADRGLLSAAAAVAWGVRSSRTVTGEVVVLGYDTDGSVDQVYRRVRLQSKSTGQWEYRLLPTPGVWDDVPGDRQNNTHALHLCREDFDPSRSHLVVCEGPWDGMTLWEARDGLGVDANVVAAPGCKIWRDSWTKFCRGKHVTLLYDSDHPRAVPSLDHKTCDGHDGMMRVARKLAGHAASVQCIEWGPAGYDSDRPSGWDVRDYLRQELTMAGRIVLASELMERCSPSTNGTSSYVQTSRQEVRSYEAVNCTSWEECSTAWREAIELRRDLSDALAVILAVCASTRQPGNQLFLDLLGSPGSAKTTICQGLLTSEHCVHLENCTKLLSGWKKPDNRASDCSFLARSNNKTWVTCEFDVLGSSPEYRQLMGKIRRIFDGETSATYGNDDEDHIYKNLRTPWIRAGTMRMLDRMADYDQSQLGDRFIRIIVADPTDEERRSIARRALMSEEEAVVQVGTVDNEAITKAQNLTGGYVNWLRTHVEEEIKLVQVHDQAKDACLDFAEMCADLRARPCEDKNKLDASVNDYKEMPTRLARQFYRLARCLAVALNKSSVDGEVLRIVRKVTVDTAYGHSLSIVQWLCGDNPKSPGDSYQHSGGIIEAYLSAWTGMAGERLYKYLNFLRKIGVLEMTHGQHGNAWLLTERMHDLYTRVMGRHES